MKRNIRELKLSELKKLLDGITYFFVRDSPYFILTNATNRIEWEIKDDTKRQLYDPHYIIMCEIYYFTNQFSFSFFTQI